MSNLEEALELLEFKSLDDVGTESLKLAYKRILIKEHPDRGGDGTRFDLLIHAYMYLRRILYRNCGGRSQQFILHPSDIRESREKQAINELNNMINQIYDDLADIRTEEFNQEFNKRYEEYYKERKEDETLFTASDMTKGYGEWLQSNEESINSPVTLLSKGEYGSATMQEPIIKEEDLNMMFEYTVRCGKSAAVNESLILHPEQMAYSVASGGMLLIPSASGFTSDWEERPEYSDLQAAYTSNNTVLDKIPVFKENSRTFEDLLKERDIEYKTELDRDLEAIAAYEKRKQEEEAEHIRRIRAYFQGTLSSAWAIRDKSSAVSDKSSAALDTTSSEVDEKKDV
jgi:hypothetical protein